MWLKTGCQIAFDINIPTPFMLMLRPRSGAQQWIELEKYILTPSTPIVEFTDIYGNLCQRLIAPVGLFSINTSVQVKTPEVIDIAPGAPFVPVQFLPDAVLSYLLPSRYCESDVLVNVACEITDGYLLGYDQVAAISQWINTNIRYETQINDYLVSATDVYQRRWGVCRDFAHLGIALCRSLCIPARMVVGYLHGLSPMDFHAWFEAYIDGRWYTFDATQQTLKPGYVVIAYGRDAADVAVFNQFGPAIFPISQNVFVEQLGNNC
ncbi:transglutaminase-like domain-containing protein [Catenovulum sediminis]|uniref:Transglutaminase family protein n=1 Tax=Catenovulum sediminis TaxID=1740262 RepID=A0ABV1RGS8_9ALTE|nr:transglutaminase family protein [Catenovulum sediminis]